MSVTFDREQATAFLKRWVAPEKQFPAEVWGYIVDGMAACVRPVAGVTLTPEQAQDAADALAYCSDLSAFTGTPEEDRYRTFAERLEEAATAPAPVDLNGYDVWAGYDGAVYVGCIDDEWSEEIPSKRLGDIVAAVTAHEQEIPHVH